MLSMTFFSDRVPSELDGKRSKQRIANEPEEAFIGPRLWSELV